MHTRLDAIENNLYSTARIVADERELNIETIIEEERLSHQPLGLDDSATDNAGLTGDYVMPAMPAVLVTKLPHVNPNTVPPVNSNVLPSEGPWREPQRRPTPQLRSFHPVSRPWTSPMPIPRVVLYPRIYRDITGYADCGRTPLAPARGP